MEKTFWDDGLRFSCTRCSACCRGEPGYVFLGMADLDLLRKRFGLSRSSFLASWCRVVDFGDERLYSLKEKPNNDCIFWDGSCAVYEDRPKQCRTYPFWSHILADRESWEREGLHCPGIGKGPLHSRVDIQEKLLERRRDLPIGPSSPGLSGTGGEGD